MIRMSHLLRSRASTVSTRFNTSARPHFKVMSSSTQPGASDSTSPKPKEQEQQPAEKAPLPLPEPRKDGDTTTIDMSAGGSSVKLDHMGPLVVNKDGTLSRISNWGEMSDIERQNTLRILGKRNQLRRQAVQGQEQK